jgi:hypothetical protein
VAIKICVNIIDLPVPKVFDEIYRVLAIDSVFP